MSTPTPNIPLLRKAVEWVEEQDKLPQIDREWNQHDYVSSPAAYAYNMAWFVISDRYEILGGRTHREMTLELAAKLEPHCGTAFCVAGYVAQLLEPEYITHEHVAGVHVSDFAQKKLGLNHDQAEDLFEGSNTAQDIRLISERIAGETL